MRNISDKQIDEIIQTYQVTNSILETARMIGVSTVKVRKVLITEGLWESDTSNKIGALLKQGYQTEEVAKILCMSVKNVQAYMPYERGTYGGSQISGDAIRSGNYRNRMKNAAGMQVVKREKIEKIIEGDAQMKENNQDLNILKFHLELDMEYVGEEEKELLKKHGHMKNSISRDILVPSDITLHALHYVIQRAFGWQNGHLHNFSLPDYVFEELTDNRFSAWAELAGVYFRYPTENFEDIYWDDDYEENQSFKSWLKKKYTGPYQYKGFSEHYLHNQEEVRGMFSRWDEITVHEFVWNAEEQPKPYNVKLKDATIKQVTNAFADIFFYELLERLPLTSLLYTEQENSIAEAKEHAKRQLKEICFKDIYEQYESTNFKSRKQRREFLEKYNIDVLPVTYQLNYSYDYGDGWEVKITCDGMLSKDEIEQSIFEEVIEKHRPVCIAKDGIELVDDVGGIHGFCEMLETIYECEFYDEEAVEERESMLAWAQMMGWTGRRIGVKQTL